MLFLVFNRKYSWIYTLHSIHNIKVLTFPLSSFGVLLLLLFHSLMMLLLLTLSTFNWKARMDLNFFNYVKYKKKQGYHIKWAISTKKEILPNCYWNKHECLIPACKKNEIQIIELMPSLLHLWLLDTQCLLQSRTYLMGNYVKK